MSRPNQLRFRILVLGFGPFGDVEDNPAARLALGAHLARLPGGGRVFGEVMEVSWAEARQHAARRAAELEPELILGIGVARGRSAPMIERFGRNLAAPELPDVRGERRSALAEAGEGRLESGLAGEWAGALEVGLSEDAGRYVCNAWIWHALDQGLPAAFLHVPDAGFDLRRLRRALRRMAAARAPQAA